MAELTEESIKELVSSYEGKESELIPILLDVQASFGYLPEDVILEIARFLNIAVGEIYSVASFYGQFRLVPIGRNRFTICRGTACHIHGAPRILEEIEREIGIKEGETSSDLEYTLESVACIGCCALAPVMKFNDDVHGEMNPEKARNLIPVLNKGE